MVCLHLGLSFQILWSSQEFKYLMPAGNISRMVGGVQVISQWHLSKRAKAYLKPVCYEDGRLVFKFYELLLFLANIDGCKNLSRFVGVAIASAGLFTVWLPFRIVLRILNVIQTRFGFTNMSLPGTMNRGRGDSSCLLDTHPPLSITVSIDAVFVHFSDKPTYTSSILVERHDAYLTVFMHSWWLAR